MKKNYSELMNQALEMIKDDDDLMMELVNELDSWNGYADTFRCYNMEELDDLLYGLKPSEVLEQVTKDFNYYDSYFYFSIWGIESTNYPAELYRDNIDEGELLDDVIENRNHIYFYNDEFEELIDDIINYDEEEEAEEE